MKERLTILLVSYDGYSDLWPTFFACKEKFWPNCPYPIVLANNEKGMDVSGLRVINCGKDAQWSTRTRRALESIDTKYIMFLLEDLFISDVVKTENIENALDLMDEDGINYYKMMTFSKIKTSLYKGFEYLHQIPSSLPYGVSLQAAIWDRNHFMEMVGTDDYNPWVFEVERLEEEQRSGDLETILGVFDSRNILNICHMVVQGKYLPRSVIHMEKVGVIVDTSSRNTMSWYESFIYSLKRLIAPFTNRHSKVRRILRIIGPKSVVSNIQKTNGK